MNPENVHPLWQRMGTMRNFNWVVCYCDAITASTRVLEDYILSIFEHRQLSKKLKKQHMHRPFHKIHMLHVLNLT